jgi:hypothetical protein
VSGSARANFLIGRVRRVAAGMADGRDPDAAQAARTTALPKAKYRHLEPSGVWLVNRSREEIVLGVSRQDRRLPALRRGLRRRHGNAALGERELLQTSLWGYQRLRVRYREHDRCRAFFKTAANVAGRMVGIMANIEPTVETRVGLEP